MGGGSSKVKVTYRRVFREVLWRCLQFVKNIRRELGAYVSSGLSEGAIWGRLLRRRHEQVSIRRSVRNQVTNSLV